MKSTHNKRRTIMDLLCHCVSQDCTNCPVYKAWREGKDPHLVFNENKQERKQK